MDDDLFDGDFDAEDAGVIGGFMGMLEEEEEEEEEKTRVRKGETNFLPIFFHRIPQYLAVFSNHLRL